MECCCAAWSLPIAVSLDACGESGTLYVCNMDDFYTPRCRVTSVEFVGSPQDTVRIGQSPSEVSCGRGPPLHTTNPQFRDPGSFYINDSVLRLPSGWKQLPLTPSRS